MGTVWKHHATTRKNKDCFLFYTCLSPRFTHIVVWKNKVWKSVWKLWKTELKIVYDFEFNKFNSKAKRLCRACGSDVKFVALREDRWIKLRGIFHFNKFHSKTWRLRRACGSNAKLVWRREDRRMKLQGIFHFNKFHSKTWRLRRACGSNAKLVWRRKLIFYGAEWVGSHEACGSN
jgi:hypothetical protein